MARTHSVAALIPTYNCAGFLPEAVASVRAQTVPVERIIVVDDGSTDDTAEVVGRLGADILYLRQQNAGPSAARNAGIRAARTDWVALLDADDLWLPDKTERQLALLDRHPELVLIASNRTEVDGAGTVILESLFEHHGLKSFFEELAGKPIPRALARLVDINFIPTSSVLARREALLELGGFNTDIRFSEDLELWCRIAAKHSLACLPEVLTLYRRHGANAVAKPEPMLLGVIQTMRSLREHCGDALRNEGIDPDERVARHLAALGYFHFDRGRYPEARSAFRQSLAEKINLRALVYLLASCLPAPAVRFTRNLKQSLSG
jgi:glycosyltransferase involved in cell wall biosynthesis